MITVTVFCGSQSTGARGDGYKAIAYELGRLLAINRFICANGGTSGMMTEVSRGAFENGGEVTAIALDNPLYPVDNPYFTNQELYTSLTERQQRLIELGDVFIALPGAVGTFYELLEVISRKGLGELSPEFPIICIGDYFEPFKDLLDHIHTEGFAWMNFMEIVAFVNTPEEAVAILNHIRPDTVSRERV